MSQYTRLKVSNKLVKDSIVVEIVKYQKKGTKREFWTPEVEGKRLTKTMYGRMACAERLGRDYIKYKQEQAA